MSTRISVKQKLLGHLEEADSVLIDLIAAISKRGTSVNIISLVELLLEKDKQIKDTLREVETNHEIQKKIDILRSDCAKSDKQIHACQLQLKQAENVLSTALYYSRQKLHSMTTAVKNPVDMEELVRFSHRISATHGAIAPENWVQGDPRRPYPNKEEIRRGYLGHLDDAGNFRSSLWDALSETAAAAASIANSSVPSTPNNPSVTNTPSAGTGPAVNSSHHPHSQGASLISGSHSTDPLAITCSPNMILPGVNMVSSPLSVPQTNPATWAANAMLPSNPSSAEMVSPQGSSSRPPSTSLAAMLAGSGMLEHSSRMGGNLPPPPLRPISNQSTPNPPSSGRGRLANTATRTVPLSPSSAATQQMHQQLYTGDTHPAQAMITKTQGHRKRSRRKYLSSEDIEMSSNSSSDSSSGEDWPSSEMTGPPVHRP